MATLANFPLVSQRTTVTGDGRPSENALFDCVAACIDAMCRYWLKQPENSVFNPDHFKDVAYGENWKNDGTDAARYVDFCKSLGIRLSMIQTSSTTDAVTVAHTYIQKGIPVILTENDPYVDTSLPQYAGWTHVCVWFSEDTNGLTALDPFIGKPLYRTNAAWANVLRSSQIWIAEPEEIMISISTPGVANYFTETAPGWWQCKNGKLLHGEILAFYTKVGGYGLCGISDLGLPVSNEIALDAKGNTKQHFERGVVFFDPGHLFDNPPGAGRVYKAHIYGGLGQDPAIALLQSELAKATQAPQQFAALEQIATEAASALGKHLV